MQDKSAEKSDYFGLRLRNLRLNAGYTTPDAFADACGVSRSTAFAWEKRETPPPPAQVLKIATALGLAREELLFSKSKISGQNSDYALEILNKLGTGGVPSTDACREYFDNFLKLAVKDDQTKLGWTWLELFERFPIDKWR